MRPPTSRNALASLTIDIIHARYVGMNFSLSPYYERILNRQLANGRFNNQSEGVIDALDRGAGPSGASFTGSADLEELLLEGLESGPAVPMTAKRRRRIYAQAG
jgi:Arc/MetJ-type ribon-helix-helix transcriptional regulator